MRKSTQRKINDALLKRYTKNGGEITKLTAKDVSNREIKPSYSKWGSVSQRNIDSRIITGLLKFASELEENLPKSEVWFRSLYEKTYKHKKDKFNQVFKARFIPDVVNKHYRYIIEIDGSIHNSSNIKAKDKRKDAFYKLKGYKVFRIEAYSINSFNEVMKLITKYRETFNEDLW